MPLIVEKDEPFDPMNIAVLGLWTIVPHADRLADLVEQLRLLNRWLRLNGGLEVRPASMTVSVRLIGLSAFAISIMIYPPRFDSVSIVLTKNR
jgi:hypothetical protein